MNELKNLLNENSTKVGISQLKAILNLWMENVSNFDHVHKLIYKVIQSLKSPQAKLSFNRAKENSLFMYMYIPITPLCQVSIKFHTCAC